MSPCSRTLFALLFSVTICISAADGAFGERSEKEVPVGRWERRTDEELNEMVPWMKDYMRCPSAGRMMLNGFSALTLRANAYKWTSDRLDYQAIDDKTAGECLRGKKILFAGDSILLQHFASAVCLMHMEGHAAEELIEHRLELPKDARGRGLLQSVFQFKDLDSTMYFTWMHYFVRDKRSLEHTRVIRIRPNELDYSHLGGTTEHLITLHKFDFIVIGVGNWLFSAFYDQRRAPRTWAEPTVTSAIRAGITRLNELFDQGLLKRDVTRIIFRSVHVNHREKAKNNTCLHEEMADFTPEFMDSPEFAAIFEANMEVLRINEILLEALAEMPIKFTYFFLDVHTISRERWEAHSSSDKLDVRKDCLHWILPGVPDFWSRVMYNAMCNLDSHDIWQNLS
mmetsp:Transcript_28045/g.47020  ORF Transcript_28045/g.47020 Transcript_28045/m.47020 type:complete len:397 (+) Transcript_28045:190-1380(+)